MFRSALSITFLFLLVFSLSKKFPSYGFLFKSGGCVYHAFFSSTRLSSRVVFIPILNKGAIIPPKQFRGVDAVFPASGIRLELTKR